MKPLFTIAIDGPSAAGKSTIAKAISARTGALYLDTGAMYRALGLHALNLGIDLKDDRAVADAMSGAEIRVRYVDGAQRVYLNGEDVSEAIRDGAVSKAASAVSAVSEVRAAMVKMQQAIAEGESCVLDGRDIGTVVLPNATLKIFLIADPEIRALRRHRELTERGGDEEYDKVLRDLLRRDHDDATRAASPLTKARDAVEVNATHLSPDAVAEMVIGLLNERLEGGPI